MSFGNTKEIYSTTTAVVPVKTNERSKTVESRLKVISSKK
jgi:hypothetical protein